MCNIQKKCFLDNDEVISNNKKATPNKITKYCYIQGPTGPQGPKGENGPTTVDVGITETGEFGTDAQVINAGTNKDVILNFKIPRGEPGEKGEKGEIGPPGPRGFPGEIGISQAITIDRTETVEPNEPAEVQDDFEGNIHHLTFYIPKGEKGENGLQGPKGEQGIPGEKGDPNGVGAYGERYSNSNQRFKVTSNTETIIPLEETGPNKMIVYNSTYSLEITKSGVYLINYFLNIATSVDTTYVVSIEVTGAKVPGSDIKVDSKANSIDKVNGTVIYDMVEFDEVTFVITSEDDTDLIFDGTTNAKLSVIKLD